MNFVDYCIATKDYSTIKAVNEYTKSFNQFIDWDEEERRLKGIKLPPNHTPTKINMEVSKDPFIDYENEVNDINFHKVPNYKLGNKLYKHLFPGQYAKSIDLKVAGKSYDELPNHAKEIVKERIRHIL